MLENLIFLNPELWIISFFIWMIFLYFYYKTKNFASKFKFISDLEAVFWSSKKYFFINILLIFIIILFFSLLIANPNLKETKTKEIKNGIDIAIVLDLSYSMLAKDIKPNRLEVAKQVISDFSKELKTDRIWLVLFSWKPFTSIPLTFDYNFVTNYVKNITIDNINQDYEHLQWTAIWEWLLYAANLFDNTDREKVIVLLSDWKPDCWDFNWDGKMDCIDPLQAVKYVWEKNIKVHTIWIWWEWEVYIKYTPKPVTFDKEAEENLKAIANLTSGEYYRADSEETFKQIFEKLNLLQKKEIEVEQFELFLPYYKVFVYILFFLITFFTIFNFYYFLRR